MRSAFGLSSWNSETKIRSVCTEAELTEEGTDIIEESELPFVFPTQVGIKALWKDFNRDEISPEVARAVVSASSWRDRYDLRMLCWMYEWYNRWSELADIAGQYPSNADYLMFFTVRGSVGFLNLKQTSFYECVVYMRHLEMGRWERGSV